MLVALLIFSLLTFGLAFLFSDAKLFGCPAKGFYQDPLDSRYIRANSVVPVRQLLMRRFGRGPGHDGALKLFFTCYFCLGFWCGAVAHLTLVGLNHVDPSVSLLSSYPLLSSTFLGTAVCTILASVVGGSACYVLDLLVQVLETKIEVQEKTVEGAGGHFPLPETEQLDIIDPDAQ